MRKVIDPGKERRSINFIDNICYSHVTDLNGRPLDLYLSLMVCNGNSEMRLADGRDDEVSIGRQPLVVWINGAGWRGCDKNLMAAEVHYLAEHGFAVACIYYRSSAQGHFPAQLIDCKTAVRFLRAHGDEYGLDTEHVGVMGRSAGGHLAAFMAMNLEGYDSREWQGYSSEIQAAVDLFGPVDIPRLNEISERLIKEPGYRWHKMEETHEGALLGGDMSTVKERGRDASPIYFINDRMCPIVIMHGDQDPLVPCEVSEDFYRRLTEAGLEDRANLYILKNGGHGTREFFQPETKKIIAEFFDRHLKMRTCTEFFLNNP
ncbi:MAG: alpha/beta hydrolase [Hungatella sp.]|nr:alpha/beta hydrolase [Hungatella sp.]